MTSAVCPILNVNELISLINDTTLRIFEVSSGPNAAANFAKKHLAGAVHIDLNAELSCVPDDFANGGRHPLPNASTFTQLLGEYGVTDDSHIILYDDAHGANAAARMWWMFRSIGHQKVQVLSGDLDMLEKEGFPISSGHPSPYQPTTYPSSEWNLPQIHLEEVNQINEDPNYRIIDVRSAERYEGIYEPIDLIAGHIPGAVNVPLSQNLDDNGLFKSAEELKTMYLAIIGDIPPNQVIVHCGSGVTACHTLLAMDYAGLPIPKLYVGSWSEWSRVYSS